MSYKSVLGVFLGLGVVILVYLFAPSLQQMQDWYTLRSYEPTPEIEELSKQAGFSEYGQRLFYVSDPQINDKSSFNANCPFEEKTIVLGCYDGNIIYILSINDEQLEGVETVTAAHEMLHAAYKRLSASQRDEIIPLLRAQFESTDNARIIKLVNEYDTSNQELIDNELHSILPTELENLSPELEDYYEQYFVDRSRVVSKAKEYEQVFVSINQRIDAQRASIEGLKTEINALESSLAEYRSLIDSGRAELERLQSEDEIELYNQKVPEFNNFVTAHNAIISQLQSTVDRHNALVEQLNASATVYNSYIQTIDSNYQEIGQ